MRGKKDKQKLPIKNYKNNENPNNNGKSINVNEKLNKFKKKKESLKILFRNAHSLRNKILELKLMKWKWKVKQVFKKS